MLAADSGDEHRVVRSGELRDDDQKVRDSASTRPSTALVAEDACVGRGQAIGGRPEGWRGAWITALSS